MWILPFVAGAVSAAFVALLARSYVARPRPHTLAWAVAMAMFCIASLAAAAGMLLGWSEGWFRVYYLFGAITNVPVLALGTAYLLAPRRVAHVAALLVALGCVAATIQVMTADLEERALETSGIPSAREVVPDTARTTSRYLSFAGFGVVVGGAVWSSLRLGRRSEPALRNLATGNLLIAFGTTVVAIGSAFARAGRGAYFAVGLAAGVSIMYAGFLRTRAVAPRAMQGRGS